MGAPRKPCSASLSNIVRGKPSPVSQSRMWGRISASAKARTAAWTRRFSSVRVKSTMVVIVRAATSSRGHVPADTLGPMTTAHDPAPNLTPVLGRYFQREWSHGQGHRLFDTDGRAYLDFANGIAVTALGHVHPRVTAAIHAQVDKLIGPISAIGFTEPISRLATDLAATFPDPLDAVMFLNSGSEAIDGALKLARRVTGRPGIIAFRGGFHGRTWGALSVTSSALNYRTGYLPALPGVHLTPFPAVYRDFGGDEDAAVATSMAHLRALVATEIPPSAVACVLIEPVQGEGGFNPAPPAFLQQLRAFCDEHGILLIADEVQTGFGRTGQDVGLRARRDRARRGRPREVDRQRPAPVGHRVVARAPGALGPGRPRLDLRGQSRGLRGGRGRPRDHPRGAPRGERRRARARSFGPVWPGSRPRTIASATCVGRG